MSPSDNGFFDKAKELTPLRSGHPGTAKGANPGTRVDAVARMSNTEKLRRTIEYALSSPSLSAEFKRALSELLSPENLAIAAGVMVVWAASHFFGVGEVVDAILIGTAYVTLGLQGMQGLADLVEFGYDVINAESDFELRRASEKLVRAIAALGAEVVLALLTRRAQIKLSGAKGSPATAGAGPKSSAPPRDNGENVRVHSPVHPVTGMKPMQIDFKCKPSLNKEEFKRQLREAQEELNKMTIEEWISNRDAFYQRKAERKMKGLANPEGRDPEGTAAQAKAKDKAIAKEVDRLINEDPALSFEAAKKKAAENLRDKVATHKLDQVAGGSGTVLSETLGGKREDFSIGAAWQSRSKKIYEEVKDLPPEAKKEKMKINITLDGEPLN